MSISAKKEMDRDEQARFFDFLDRPVFILEAGGTVSNANRAATALLGYDPRGLQIEDLTSGPPEKVRAYLARCAGSGSATLGSLILKTGSGEGVKVQAAGARLSTRGQKPALLVLRCSAERPREFSVLARHVESLNTEIRKRRNAQEQLERSLHLKEMLLHELHHRVKNQMQMLLAMLSMAARSTDNAAVLSLLESLGARLRAMTAAQDLMYDAERLATVPAKPFMEKLVRTISASWPANAAVSVDAAEAELRNDVAVPLALIVNELLANALKHGLEFGPGRVAVVFEELTDALRLTVRDDGPGMAEEPASSPSSGLTLVRGLCEQIGGSLEFSTGGKSCFTVRFPRS